MRKWVGSVLIPRRLFIWNFWTYKDTSRPLLRPEAGRGCAFRVRMSLVEYVRSFLNAKARILVRKRDTPSSLPYISMASCVLEDVFCVIKHERPVGVMKVKEKHDTGCIRVGRNNLPQVPMECAFPAVFACRWQ